MHTVWAEFALIATSMWCPCAQTLSRVVLAFAIESFLILLGVLGTISTWLVMDEVLWILVDGHNALQCLGVDLFVVLRSSLIRCPGLRA